MSKIVMHLQNKYIEFCEYFLTVSLDILNRCISYFFFVLTILIVFHPIESKGYPSSRCGESLSGQNDSRKLTQLHISGNSLFPQSYSLISLPMVVHYLTQPGSIRQFIAQPSDREIELVVQALNRLHDRHRINSKTPDKVRRGVDTPIPLNRVSGLLTAYRKGAVRQIIGIANIVGAPLNSPFEYFDDDLISDNLALKVIDEIFLDPKQAETARRMMEIGKSISDVIESQIIRSSARDNLAFIRDHASKSNEGISDLTSSLTSKLEKLVRSELSRELKKTKIGITENQIETLLIYIL
ncbi:MAG: hypothetical protein KDD35_00860 [Bdellovibrionales bacterium]|nr:hypothetical protein [Bdellovibrionales bacterium]